MVREYALGTWEVACLSIKLERDTVIESFILSVEIYIIIGKFFTNNSVLALLKL